MSQASIPNITPLISVTRDQSIVLLLSSVALEEMALANLINAEAEKIQYMLGTLSTPHLISDVVTVESLLAVNKSTQKAMNGIVLKEMLLLMKLDKILELDGEDCCEDCCEEHCEEDCEE